MRRFFSVSSPFYSGDGAGGSQGDAGQGAGGSGPIAGQNVDLGGGGGAGASIFDLTPDAMVRVPGAKDPVKFSDWQKNYVPQSEFTKKTQALAKERADWEKERETAASKLIEEARKIAESRRGQGGGHQEDPLAELRNANYIDGKTAAGMLEAIQARGIKPIIDAIGQRDEVIRELHKQVTGLSGLVNKMQEASGVSALGERIKSVGKNLGLPEDPSVHEWLQDLYASHEGPDWDQNFETTAKSRIEGLRKALREADRKAAADAKKKLLTGQGGNATPGSGLKKGYRKPSDIADSFAEALGIPD